MDPLSRTQPKVCSVCRKPFWSWGLKRTECQQCSPFTLKQAYALVEKINHDDPLIRL